MTDHTIFRPAATEGLVALDEPAVTESADVADTAPRSPAAPALGRPRTRWAAIIWGLVLGGIAAGALRVLLDPALRDGVSDWILGLSPLTIAAYAILVLGGLLLVAGLAGLAGRAQRRLAASRNPA